MLRDLARFGMSMLLGLVAGFVFDMAVDLLIEGKSLQEALINGVMSSMIGMAIRWLGEATGLIPTHVDAPHYRGTLNGDVRAPGTQRVRPNMDVDTRLSLDAETRINLDPEARVRTARPADLEAQVDLTQRRTWYSGDSPQSGQKVYFGQARVAPQFSTSSMDARVPDYLSGRSIADVAEDLRTGTLSSDDILIQVFEMEGKLVAINNRGLAALSAAGLRPTNIEVVANPTNAVRRRLTQNVGVPRSHNVPGNSIQPPSEYVAITPGKSDLRVIEVVRIPK